MTALGVIGGGTMGTGVAYVFAAAGYEVTVAELDETQRQRVRTTVVAQAQRAVERGKLDRGGADALADRIDTVAGIGDLPQGLDLIIEAVPERAELKQKVLAAAEDRHPRLLATNTSSIGIGLLGKHLTDQSRFIGMHFFNPVWSMPLLEVVRGAATSDEALRQALETGRIVGKQTIVVNDSPGFATSRLGVALGLEAIRMLEEEVASAADIDTAMELGYRHPMGPLKLTDQVGLDVRLDIARHLESSFGPRFAPPKLLIDKVAAGETGRKAGRGFYDWPKG